MDLRDLAGLAAEMYQRSRPDLPDEDPARAFEDRAVRLETTFGGAGVMSGDLTPECAAVVGAVLDALGAPAGAEDTRTHAQRYHDALLEAMRSFRNGLLTGHGSSWRWGLAWTAPICLMEAANGQYGTGSAAAVCLGTERP